MTEPATLSITDLRAGHGSVEVVHGVTIEVRSGETVGLLGRNGAGKTTTLRAVAGLCPQVQGRISIGDGDLRGRTASRIAASGVALVSEGHRIFRSLSVGENLRIGAFVRRRNSSGVAADLDRVLELFPALRGRERQVAGQLSGGEQQMVALAQALMAAPRFLLLDEPAAGLAPIIVDAIYAAVTRLRDQGIGILVVEQTVERALRECSRAYVMESGRVVLSGDAATLAEDHRVDAIVLGGTPGSGG